VNLIVLDLSMNCVTVCFLRSASWLGDSVQTYIFMNLLFRGRCFQDTMKSGSNYYTGRNEE